MLSEKNKSDLIDLAGWAAAALGVAVMLGLPSCARGQAMPSPQAPAKGVPGWQPAGPREPRPAPPVPRTDFQAPPTDQTPDELTPTPTPPVPSTPDPAPPAPPRAPSKARTVTTTTTDAEGPGLIISGNSGPVYYNSPGASPPPASSPQADPGPRPGQFVPIGLITAVATSPQVQSFTVAALKRIGGGLSYMVTGQCPGKAAPPAAPAAPQFYALQPTTTYQAVPVQVATPAPPAAPQMVLMTTPQPPVQAAPQTYAVAAPAPAPASPKKCWLFGR